MTLKGYNHVFPADPSLDWELCEECGVEEATVTASPVVDDEERSNGPRRESKEVCVGCASLLVATGNWQIKE